MSTRSDDVRGACDLLESKAATPEQIIQAIVQIGKPLDETVVKKTAALIASYLHHDDFLVRYQAIWFLSSWGRLPEYISEVIKAAKQDPNVDNRAFAARSAGLVLKKQKDKAALQSLAAMVEDQNEEPEVRTAAYSALLRTWNKREARDFEPMGDKSVEDIEVAWLERVKAWIGDQP
jgi:HEAT repeat protein